MKVLTYNIRGWRTPSGALNVEQLAAVIADSGADLVGLNEVFHPYPADKGPALERLADQLGMAYAFAPTIEAEPTPDTLPYGNAVLSRWPILAYAGHHLTPAASYGQRGLLEARVLMPDGRPFSLYVTHLDHRSEALRMGQWRTARLWLARDRSRPHLLVGDFNALSQADYATPDLYDRLVAHNQAQSWGDPEFELIAQVLQAGYVDAFAHNGSCHGPTWPAQNPERRIDYIFLAEQFLPALRHCERWESALARTASDHLPLFAEFAW